jgi:glycosyltransferase involved in cell wall biosynthesis
MTAITPAEVESRAARLILHQFDPFAARAGGIDTCISDLIAYAPPGVVFAVVGVTSSGGTVGRWRAVEHRDRELLFLPVARLSPREVRLVPYSLRVAAGLARWRRQVPSLTLQSHRLDLGAAAQTVTATAARRIQFVHNPHARGEGVLGGGSDSFWRFAPFAYRALEPRVLAHADRIIVFSRPEAERLQALGHPALPWRTWFDPAFFFPTRPADRNGGHLRLAWVGRFEQQKDPLLALETLHALRGGGVPATLTMVGGGALRASVERRLRELGLGEVVSLRPVADRQAVADVMRDADVMLMTSRYEGSPRVVVEALACATPVATPSAADPDGLIVEGETGAVAASREPAELAGAVRRASAVERAKCAASVATLAADEAVPRLLSATELAR